MKSFCVICREAYPVADCAVASGSEYAFRIRDTVFGTCKECMAPSGVPDGGVTKNRSGFQY